MDALAKPTLVGRECVLWWDRQNSFIIAAQPFVLRALNHVGRAPV
jgi:hypothetical protein